MTSLLATLHETISGILEEHDEWLQAFSGGPVLDGLLDS
jgi:hypothetical protein